MRKLLSTACVALLMASLAPWAAPVLHAQASQDLGEPKLKSRDLRRLQGALQDWFSAEIEIANLSNAAEGDSRRARSKISKLNKVARKARVEFLERLEKNEEALASVPDLLAIFDGCFPYPSPFSRGDIKREYADEKAKTGAYWMRRPKGYKPAQNWPLVVSLVSRGGNPEKYIDTVWPPTHEFSDNTLFAAPELSEDVDLSVVVDILNKQQIEAEGAGRSWFLRTLAGLFNGYRLDTDRLYLEAVGDSTPFAMRIVSLFPDRFGGLILRNPQGIENLAAENCHLVPILIVGTKDDETVDKLEKRLSEAGHPNFKVLDAVSDPPYADMSSEVIEWTKGASRNLFSPKVRLEPVHDRFRKGYWVEIREGAYLNQVAADQRPMVEAVADREKNRIEITARNVSTIMLYLNDALVDLDKEITLVINGKIREEKRTRNARRLASLILKRNDTRFVFVSEGIFDVPKLEAPASAPDSGSGNGSDKENEGRSGDPGR